MSLIIVVITEEEPCFDSGTHPFSYYNILNDLIIPKQLLTLLQEMSTAEQFSASTNITITVLDGDDQYPQFLPCMLLFQDESNRVCTNPVYTVNVTEGEEVSCQTRLQAFLTIYQPSCVFCIMCLCVIP